MTMTPEQATPDTESSSPDAEGPIRVPEDASALLEKLSGGLELWRTRTEAALFVASLAAARDADVPEPDELDEFTRIGHTDEAEDALEGLAVLGLLSEDAPSPGVVRERWLPSWVQAGASIVAPRLRGQSVDEAADEILALVAEVDGAGSPSGAPGVNGDL